MIRAIPILAIFALLPAAAVAQDDGPGTHVYEAYYQISYADLDDWTRQYHEYAVPILTALRDEGVIRGWAQYQHDVGSEYNIRFAVRTGDWASLDTFWREYLSRMQQAMPAAEWQASSRMIEAHDDQIWNFGEVHVPEGVNLAYLYASTFRFNFGDTAEWNRVWSEVAGPILARAMEQGLLGGWAKLDHNTGGPHNSKILYMFEEWDDIDDLFAMLLGEMAQRPDFEKIMGLIGAHDDVIWVPTPAPGM